MKKTLLSILLILVMAVSLATATMLIASAVDGDPCAADGCGGTYVNGFCTADGTHYEPATDSDSDGYYEIDNAGKLYWFAAQVNGGSKSIKAVLTADIVVNQGVLTESGELNGDGAAFRQWTPIGKESALFEGKFDGRGHTVSGLYYVGSDERVGLFGSINSYASVQNLGVIDSYFEDRTTGCAVGAIVGYAGNSSMANHCSITNCFSTATIKATNTYASYYGGIAGYVNYNAVISECYYAGNVLVEGIRIKVGGVLGLGYNATVRDCYNVGHVSVTETGTYMTCAGGIVGESGGTTKAILSNCYSAMPIVTEGEVLAGEITGKYADGSTLSNCYYLADQETDGMEGTTFKTAEQFASGEVAYLLNNNVGGADTWRQTLGGQEASLPDFTGDAVYMICDGTTVSYGATDSSTHAWENGVCQACGTEHDHSGSGWTSGTCNDCGLQCTHEGNTDTDSDPDTHSFTCVTCGMTHTAQPHDWENGECATCGLVCSHTWQTGGYCSNCHIQAEAGVTVAGHVTYYITVEQAFEAVEDADSQATLTLLADVQIEQSLSGGRIDDLTLGFVFDLAGKTIYNPHGSVIEYLYDNGTMIIKDSKGGGEIISGSGPAVKSYSSVDIFGGTFRASINDPYTQAAALSISYNYIYDQETETGYYSDRTRIYGGSFYSSDNAVSCNVAEVFIYGGTFEANDGIFDNRSGAIHLIAANFPNGIAHDSFGYYADLTQILDENSVFLDAQGNVIELTEGTTELEGAVSVKRQAIVENKDYELNYLITEPIPEPLAENFNITSDVGAQVTFRWFRQETELSGMPTEYGSYILEVSVADGESYKGVSARFAIEVVREEPEASDFSFTLDDAVYDGEPKQVTVTSLREGMGEITVMYFDAYGENQLPSAPQNAGTYAVKIVVGEGSHYKATTQAITLGTITIEKSTPIVTAPTATAPVYNGEAHSLIEAGSTVGGTMTYAMIEGSYNGVDAVSLDFSQTIPTATDAGTYTVFYRVEGDDNYKDVAGQYIIVTVEKAVPVLQVTAPVTTVLPGNNILFTAAADVDEVSEFYVEAGELYTAEGMIAKISPDAVIGRDSVTVTVVSVESRNYKSAKATVTLSVEIPDVSDELEALDADIALLNDLIADKADATEIAAQLSEITGKLEVLEESGATDAELQAVKAALTEAYTAAVEQVKQDLADAKTELENAIGANESDIEDKVARLDEAYKAADTLAHSEIADLREEDNAIKKGIIDLESAMNGTVNTLMTAIETVQQALDATKTELEKAIKQNQSDIKDAEQRLDATKTELENEIDQGQSDLEDQVARLEKASREELEAKEKKLRSFTVVVCVISGVALCGCGTLAVFYVLDKRKLR